MRVVLGVAARILQEIFGARGGEVAVDRREAWRIFCERKCGVFRRREGRGGICVEGKGVKNFVFWS